jgi:hypothetical protein
MSEEDAEDYMSEKWIAELNHEENKSKILVQKERQFHLTHEQKRKKIESNDGPLSIFKLERLKREKAMNDKIDEKNKGYELLKKMGYKQGMTLGHSTSGLEVPISVTMKESRYNIQEKESKVQILI